MRFATSSGTTIEASLFPQFPRVSAETSTNKLRRLAPLVDANTVKPLWTGEAMDYSMAVDGLLRRNPGGPHT